MRSSHGRGGLLRGEEGIGRGNALGYGSILVNEADNGGREFASRIPGIQFSGILRRASKGEARHGRCIALGFPERACYRVNGGRGGALLARSF